MTLNDQLNEFRSNLIYLRIFANDDEKYHVTKCLDILDIFIKEFEIDKETRDY